MCHRILQRENNLPFQGRINLGIGVDWTKTDICFTFQLQDQFVVFLNIHFINMFNMCF